MKKIHCASVLVLFAIFLECAGSRGKVGEQEKGAVAPKAKTFAIMPFNYIGTYPPSYNSPDVIVVDALKVAFMKKGYYVTSDEEMQDKLSDIHFELKNMNDEQARTVGSLLNVDIIFSGYVSAFHEIRGNYADIDFVAKAYDVSNQTIILRERMHQSYEVYKDPIGIVQDMAWAFLQKLQTMGHI